MTLPRLCSLPQLAGGSESALSLIRDKPIAPASPWQNAVAERLIGSIRRECLDHIVVLGEAHLRRILKSYTLYYNETRTTWPWTRMRPYRAP
jgi:transposase InsO family protein